VDVPCPRASQCETRLALIEVAFRLRTPHRYGIFSVLEIQSASTRIKIRGITLKQWRRNVLLLHSSDLANRNRKPSFGGSRRQSPIRPDGRIPLSLSRPLLESKKMLNGLIQDDYNQFSSHMKIVSLDGLNSAEAAKISPM